MMHFKDLSDDALLKAYKIACAKARCYDWYRIRNSESAARKHRRRAAEILAVARLRGLTGEG